MPAADIPDDEADRKHALDALNILDSLPEAFSDSVSIAAAAIANVPISAVSIVDSERQWFKSSCGLDVAETPREVSFCAHAILGTEPFLVPDALKDLRFCDNPLVTGAPFIRSYAGFPIIVRGQAIGALCVIDNRPRSLTTDQIDRLSRLAAGTAAWLSERQAMVSAIGRTEAELRYVTLNDTVTGLPNRILFQDRLKQAGVRCEQTGTSLAVLFIDLDGFKAINVACGERHGDQALREVGQLLLGLVGPAETAARIGGDQFLLLTERAATIDDLAELATLVCTELGKLSARASSGNAGATLTASVGVSLYPIDGALERVVANADTAMIAAKRAGGNGWRFFQPQMDVDAQARAALLERLRFAVERDELELHYQPKIHTRSGHVTGAEALLRWNHPQCGMISPAVFVPLAEGAGLINEIGRWVIVEACRQMQAWSEAGIRMRLAINLSVHQLRQPELPEQIAAELHQCDVDPALLICEITESVAMDDATAALDVFKRLNTIGVKLSIDDFGTGYSSLSYLRKLPVQQLKIDRSFVIDLAESDDARAIAAAIVNLAHALRLGVVAEGVETAQQRDILLALGCDELQGYLFAKPMTAKAFTDWALDRDRLQPAFRPSLFGSA